MATAPVRTASLKRARPKLRVERKASRDERPQKPATQAKKAPVREGSRAKNKEAHALLAVTAASLPAGSQVFLGAPQLLPHVSHSLHEGGKALEEMVGLGGWLPSGQDKNRVLKAEGNGSPDEGGATDNTANEEPASEDKKHIPTIPVFKTTKDALKFVDWQKGAVPAEKRTQFFAVGPNVGPLDERAETAVALVGSVTLLAQLKAENSPAAHTEIENLKTKTRALYRTSIKQNRALVKSLAEKPTSPQAEKELQETIHLLKGLEVGYRDFLRDYGMAWDPADDVFDDEDPAARSSRLQELENRTTEFLKAAGPIKKITLKPIEVNQSFEQLKNELSQTNAKLSELIYTGQNPRSGVVLNVRQRMEMLNHRILRKRYLESFRNGTPDREEAKKDYIDFLRRFVSERKMNELLVY